MTEIKIKKVEYFGLYEVLIGMVRIYGSQKIKEALTEIISNGNLLKDNLYCSKCGQTHINPNNCSDKV